MDQQEIFKEALAMQEELTTWRHALHQMPELSLDLPKTSAFVQTRLAEMDVPFHTIVNGNGVVAQLGEGEPCLLLRADMDALPVAETSGVDFASTNGCMHACGHDMHTTSLLGAAKLLKAHEAELCGTVKLLFQPGEETFNGAEACIKDGVLESPHVDAAVATHVASIAPVGLVAYGDVPNAAVYGFKITLTGKGTHGAMPALVCDAAFNARLAESVQQAAPALAVHGGVHTTGSEDFAFFAPHVPTAMFFIGAETDDGTPTYNQHNPSVRFNDKALPIAAAVYAISALSWQREQA